MPALLRGAQSSDSVAQAKNAISTHVRCGVLGEEVALVVLRTELKRASQATATSSPTALAGLSEPEVGSVSRKLRNASTAKPIARSVNTT